MREVSFWTGGIPPRQYKSKVVLKLNTEVWAEDKSGCIVGYGSPGNKSSHYLVLLDHGVEEWFSYWEVKAKEAI